MIITVGGSIGSGKSTLAKKLAYELGFNYYSVGDAMRALAEEKRISLNEFGALAEKDQDIDEELDGKQKEVVSRGDWVLDSRLGAHVVDADFKIWLVASPDVFAKRIAGRDHINLDEAKAHVIERRASEIKRYKEIYNIDLEDTSIYDLVLNTDNLEKEDVLKTAIDALNKFGI
jgi:cytidylate kinase